ncbi:barwin-like endoglucanase [Epithele typhae]|uniref:barwin-like endoglucanase n=1 Tax=Epithele typhae TaxID=378194 RepID=UPI00200825B6|nr:barwin-like endoglucanase [Epithele typhae]KAH9926625.1 barwin-like endoglucanase [Epithele typhae]
MRFSAVLLAALSAVTVGYAQTASGTGDLTFYAPGLGSCGHTNTDADFVVAIDTATITSFPGATANPNLNPMCGRQISITVPGAAGPVMATVVDTCFGCARGSIDVSPAVFQQVAALSVGRISGVSWTLV